jgi:hypothetical protein
MDRVVGTEEVVAGSAKRHARRHALQQIQRHKQSMLEKTGTERVDHRVPADTE